MLIRVEPAGFSMYRVHLLFDRERPDGEDQAVHEYLAANELEPRYQHMGEWEGRPGEELIFGGCYLGRHLEAIAQIQRETVQRELLAEAITEKLSRFWTERGELNAERRACILAELVNEFNKPEAFQANDRGELVIAVDEDSLRQAAERLSKSNGAGDGNRTHVTSLEG